MSITNADHNYYNIILRLLKTAVLIQALQLVGTFILTLYFSAENFGSLSFILSVSVIFEMVAGLQYNTAAIVADDKSKALKLMSFAAIVAAALAALVLLIIAVCYLWMPSIYNFLNSYTVIFALPFIIITNFFFNNSLQILKYLGKINEVNKLRWIYVLATLGLKLLAAFLFPTVTGLVYAHALGGVLACLFFSLYYRDDIKNLLTQNSYKSIQLLLKENYRFPKYAILSGVVNAAANISFPILITLFFGLHQNGIYYLTALFIFQPLQLILQSVSDAFLSKIKSMFYSSRQALLEFIKEQQKLILKLVLVYIFVALLAGELLFQLILPSKWTEVGKLIKYVAVFYICASLYSPFSIVGDYMKKQRFLLLFNLSLFLFQFATLYFLHTKLNFVWVILIASLISAVHYAFINFYMLGILKKNS